MDDCISRKAAIDAVDSETVSTNPEHFKSSEKFIKFMDDADIASFGNWQWANGFNTALTATTIHLENLPSAEPVRKPDEWCVDCKEYDHEKNCCPRFNRVIKSALNDAEPEISRIEQELHGKTPEEQYEFIYWLLFKSALGYSNSRLTIIEWLRGEKEDG